MRIVVCTGDLHYLVSSFSFYILPSSLEVFEPVSRFLLATLEDYSCFDVRELGLAGPVPCPSLNTSHSLGSIVLMLKIADRVSADG